MTDELIKQFMIETIVKKWSSPREINRKLLEELGLKLTEVTTSETKAVTFCQGGADRRFTKTVYRIFDEDEIIKTFTREESEWV